MMQRITDKRTGLVFIASDIAEAIEIIEKKIKHNDYNVEIIDNKLGAQMMEFKPGDRVVLLDPGHKGGASKSDPVWGWNGEYIVGTFDMYLESRLRVEIAWDNGARTAYDLRYAKIVLEKEIPKKEKQKIDFTALDSIVLKQEAREEIEAVLKQHDNAKKIFEDWGLAETIEYGRGMTFLFWGPPGTGKTWAAKRIAKALHTDIISIGAAEIQSSEPGGANRAIQNAFSEAKSKGKVLFIDECDSLITNRQDVGMILSSEINTLLTEIEKFEGVCILATNRIETLDEALERRLSLIVEFPLPSYEERVEIWKRLIPAKLPLHENAVFEKLGEWNLSGGQIKNVIMHAVRMAISEEAKKVTIDHFGKAHQRLSKSAGKMGTKSSWRQSIGVSMDKRPEIIKDLNIDKS